MQAHELVLPLLGVGLRLGELFLELGRSVLLGRGGLGFGLGRLLRAGLGLVVCGLLGGRSVALLLLGLGGLGLFGGLLGLLGLGVAVFDLDGHLFPFGLIGRTALGGSRFRLGRHDYLPSLSSSTTS